MASITRDEVEKAVIDYLEVVAKVIDENLIEKEVKEEKQWMVRTSPTGMASKVYTRTRFNIFNASIIYQLSVLLKSDYPIQERLRKILDEAGIPRSKHLYIYLLPLVSKWLSLPNPLPFNKQSVLPISDKFADLILNNGKNEEIFQSTLVLELIKFSGNPIVLENGVTIRQINEEELWEFSNSPTSFSLFDKSNPLKSLLLGEESVVIDIKLKYKLDDSSRSNLSIYKEAVPTALCLVAEGSFQVHDLGITFDIGNSGIQTFSGRSQYNLDDETGQLLKNTWPKVITILKSNNHYLRLPAQRLADGCRRGRLDDAVMDYSIGLEALLTASEKDELKYRFSLRGATILHWNDRKSKKQKEKRLETFNNLKKYYDIRSKIVHAQKVKIEDLRDKKAFGETSLRNIWWWCFYNAKSLKEATDLVDSRILK